MQPICGKGDLFCKRGGSLIRAQSPLVHRRSWSAVAQNAIGI